MLATTFATIVGLLSSFKSERSSTDLSEFMEWLEEKHHETIATFIRSNENLETNLRAILNTNHEVLVERLQRLDVLISSVAGQIDEFSGLAKAVYRESIFSDQAILILTQLVDSGAKFFMESKIRRIGGIDEYVLMDGGIGKIKYDEPRFIEDDLDALVSNGLLSLKLVGDKGTRRFYVTRAAVSFISELNK